MLCGLVYRHLCLRTTLLFQSSEYSKNSRLSSSWTAMKMERAQGQVAGSCECGNEPPGSFLTSWGSVSFRRRTLLHGVSHIGNGTGLSRSTSGFPCHWHPTVASNLPSCHWCYSLLANGSGGKNLYKKGIWFCWLYYVRDWITHSSCALFKMTQSVFQTMHSVQNSAGETNHPLSHTFLHSLLAKDKYDCLALQLCTREI